MQILCVIVCINNIDEKILEIYLIKILPDYFTEEYCGEIRWSIAEYHIQFIHQ